MIYVWAMEQKNRHFEKQDVLVPWNKALCSQALSEAGQPGRRQQCGRPQRGAPHRPPCSACRCSECFEGRRDSKRSHSVGCDAVLAGTCCANTSEEGEEENGFYNMLGRSFRSWFSSRSLDESTLRKQIEKVRPLKTTGSWANSTISIQPSRHSSFDLGRPETLSTGEQHVDEEVFVEPSQGPLERLRAPTTRKQLNGDHPGVMRRNGGGNFLGGSNARENCVEEDSVEEDTASGSELWRGVSAADSTDSNPGDAISVEEQQPDVLDSRAFMRYYHVFREGELCGLLKERVPELHILSCGNDHGNWCVVAEKTGSRD